MFVHGEQVDTILASLLALMASLQSLSRRFVVRLVRHRLSSAPSHKKIPLVLLLHTAHSHSVRKNNITPSDSESCKERWHRQQLSSVTPFQGRKDVHRFIYDSSLTLLTSISPPWILKTQRDSVFCPGRFVASLPIESPHISITEPCMSSCMREDGSRMWALWLAGRPWCVCGKVPLVGSLRTTMLDKGGPSLPSLLSLLYQHPFPCSALPHFLHLSSSSSSSSVSPSALQSRRHTSALLDQSITLPLWEATAATRWVHVHKRTQEYGELRHEVSASRETWLPRQSPWPRFITVFLVITTYCLQLELDWCVTTGGIREENPERSDNTIKFRIRLERKKPCRGNHVRQIKINYVSVSYIIHLDEEWIKHHSHYDQNNCGSILCFYK